MQYAKKGRTTILVPIDLLAKALVLLQGKRRFAPSDTRLHFDNKDVAEDIEVWMRTQRVDPTETIDALPRD